VPAGQQDRGRPSATRLIRSGSCSWCRRGRGFVLLPRHAGSADPRPVRGQCRFGLFQGGHVTHRPLPPAAPQDPLAPARVWRQSWEDLLFLHWRVAPSDLTPHVPSPLQVETFDGRAWVSLVLFRLWVRPRWLPFLPGVSSLLEANLRTYVHLAGKPGIWFL